ncbi:zinc finger protein 608 [Corythoichthys intestinalis]|uniref:zinc finger protein 608 n=1 Tax=Corythoichthys intestinalis TaxID=161448 RepID=UPI0025A65269|nr:zinc finger protein 608 [Corythoichthys intestinalis]
MNCYTKKKEEGGEVGGEVEVRKRRRSISGRAAQRSACLHLHDADHPSIHPSSIIHPPQLCALDCGLSAPRRPHDDVTNAAKKHRGGAHTVEPMFTPPGGAPAPGQAGAAGPSLPSSVPSIHPAVVPPTCNTVRTRSIGTNTQEVALPATPNSDADFLGPCQPGTSVNLEGIVWHETQEGVLVVNVTWRKRTYVGTLLDCTKLDWAPPRFCESPSSDLEMPGGRGRGKRLRLALADRPCGNAAPPVKMRGLPQHRSRGGGIAASPVHSKGRRGSLKLLSNCRASPPFFSTEETKPANRASVLPSGKRKNKPPANLDLTLVSSEDIKNGNGKRIRAKCRSAPSTPQGKSDPSFLDPGGGCTSSPPPILIDCPHPNCTKRYKHINGLRYHQTHAHLEVEEQRNPEVEERLSDCEDAVYDLMESSTNVAAATTSSKKATPIYKVTTVGSPKNRRLLLSTKTRRSSLLKDDLSNLPIISNMTVVLENCMVPDRSATVEMPKLEAEGLIDKKILCDKSKKSNGKVDKLSKSRTNRLIAPAPTPPKLIAIPNAAYPTDSGTSQQPSSVPVVGMTSKNSSLKPIKPKLNIIMEPSLVKSTLVTCKEPRKKEKRRTKDKQNRDATAWTANGDAVKMEEGAPKIVAKEIPGSLLKEHLSKQDMMIGLNESQESRMASIRAEADKVYTFTDNAPSPSIGSSSRLDAPGGSLLMGDSKDNSPAYSDISDAGDDGVSSENRLEGLRPMSGSSVSSEVNSTSNHSNTRKTPPMITAPHPTKEPQSPYYHSFEPYFLPGYSQAERQNTYHKSSSNDSKAKDQKEDDKDDDKGPAHDFADCKKGDVPAAPSQLQLAMSQTQTALAQSLYYGQYSRGLYIDQKLLLTSKCCEQKQRAERVSTGRDGDVRHTSGPKGHEGAKGCCPKPTLSYLDERGERGLGLKVDQHHVSAKDCEDIKSLSTSSSTSLSSLHHTHNTQTDLDSNVPYSSPPDGPTWPHRLAQSKFSELQSPLGEAANEGDAEVSKEWGNTTEPAEPKATSVARDAKNVHGSHNLPPPIDPDESDGQERQQEEPVGVLSGESQSARAAVSPPMTPQQPYMQYQPSSYPPYLAMCESSGGSYRGASPTLVHNYPGFHYPLYGKTAGREDAEPDEKGSLEAQREVDRSDRGHAVLGRHLHTHHHTHLGLTYNLVAGQYDIYPGLSSRSLVSGPQVSGRTSADGEVKK